jgi:hypothetical protein
MTNRPDNPPVISQSDMRPGDVILSRGAAAGISEGAVLDELILALDQGDYTHSSLWDGQYVIEALTTGVAIKDPLEMTLKNQVLIDVYRYKMDGREFGNTGYPVTPLLDAARAFEGYAYGYSKLVLSAMLLVTCELPKDAATRVLLKLVELPVLEAVEKWQKGEHAMVCSEVVAQAFWNASTTPVNQYGLPIVLDGHRHFPDPGAASSALMSLQADTQASPELLELHQLRSNLTGMFAAAMPAVPAAPAALATATVTGVTLVAGSSQLPAMFVTPGDLQRCSDLQFVGTIPSQHVAG